MKFQKLITLILLVFGFNISFSQNFQLKSSTLNNGSGTATSTTFQLNGAVGEISSGPSTSTSFVLNTGSVSNRVASAVNPGLIAHYPLDGNLLDATGNGYDAVAAGTLELSTDVAGINDKAYYFDGFETKAYHIFAEPLNLTNFTVSVWVYIEDPSATFSQHIFGLESSTRLFQMVTYQGNFGFWEGSSDGTDDLGYVSLGQVTEGWHNFIVVWDGTVVTGYIDGTELNYGDALTSLNFDVEELNIGANNAFGEYLEGAVDEVKLFNYPLSGEEVQNLFFSYPVPPAAPQNLQAKVIGPGSIQLTWEDGANESYYDVYWEDPDLQSGYIALGPDVTSYTLTGLTTDFEYYIEVGAGNDYFGYDYSMIYQTPVDKGPTQAAPEYFTLDETVTIQFYPQLSYPVDDLTSASKVYMYAGLIKPEDVASGAWSNSVGNWGVDDGIGEMTYNLGVWEITITPRSYFGVPDNFVAAQIAIVFTNEDGTLLGKAADLEDIKLEIFDPTNIAPLGGFLDTDASTDVYLDDVSAFTPLNLKIESLTEYTIEALVNFGDANPGIGSFKGLVTRGFDDGSYTDYHGIVYYELDAVTAYPTGIISTDVMGPTNPYTYDPPSVDVTGVGGGETYSNGTWAHVALVYTTPSYGNMDVYINGIYQGFVEIYETPLVGNMLRIGQFEGGVDELRFWNDVRTQEELRINMKSEIDPNSEGLIGYWKMNGTTAVSGTDYIVDETSSLNDLVVGNAIITQLPDLDVITLAVNPKSIAQTETLSVSYTIENIGPADAGAFDVDFYVSADAVFDGTDTQLGSSVNFASGLTTGESVFNIFQASIPDEGTVPNGSYFIIAVIDGIDAVEEENETNNTATAAIDISTANTNTVTTSITLDNYSFAENAPVGTKVGGIFYDDPDEDLFDITLVAGTGDTDNTLFQILGGELLTNAIRDFEVDPTSYSVRIQVDDNRGGVYAEAITLTLTDVNDNPSNINLSGTSIVEGTYSAGGSEFVIGTLTTDDQDAGDTHTYIISSGGTVSTGSTVGVLSINGNNELIASGNYSRNDLTELSITINSQDQEGGSIDLPFTITIDPAGLAPTALLLTNNTINENHGAGATIGQFFAVDSDSDTHIYALAAGGTDNSEFSVSSAGVLTQNNENLAVGTYSIRVSATDDTDLSITRTFEIKVISDAVSGVISVGGSISNYRIISVPFTNSTVGNTFPDLTNENNFTDWRMFGYNNGNLSEIKSVNSSLSQANGYWFITTIPQEIELSAGNINTNATIQKSLSEGWNLIGNPYLKALNWDNILEFNGNPSSVGVDVHIWNGGWTTKSNLGVMQGGFIEVIGAPPTTFEFYPSTASVGTARVASSSRTFKSYFDNTNAWQLFLNLESNGMTSNISGVGLNEIAVDEKDMLDKSAPPTPAVFDPLQLTEKLTGLTKNIKAVNHSVFWDFALTGTQESTTITWDQNVASQLDEPLIIALLPQGDLYDMSSMGELTFQPEKNQSVMVVYGDELPKELLYNAITAYPNPADQEVNFRFYVDHEGNVPAAIEFYDISGQRIGAIDQMVTGNQWNEINYKVATQDLLKSGIYFFRVKYADFESAVKRLIIK
ncbi:MAG: LamG-like jellyroll fold domain-containing protein [Cyclobacteriaceae bacterium]